MIKEVYKNIDDLGYILLRWILGRASVLPFCIEWEYQAQLDQGGRTGSCPLTLTCK